MKNMQSILIIDDDAAIGNLEQEILEREGYSMAVEAAEELHFEPVCINDVLEQSLAGVYGALSERGITPEIGITGHSLLRTLDKQALRRIFDNILSNTAKYSDGDLAVWLLPDGTVLFKNHAKNLDAVRTVHLFDRFFTVNTAKSGTGLGLFIARLLTEKMNGSITAEYNEGSLCISVLFPDN